MHQQDDFLRPFDSGYNITPRSRVDLGAATPVPIVLMTIGEARIDQVNNVDGTPGADFVPEFDAHRFDAGRKLRLGGLEFPGEPGLAGHSDGDVALHAAIDALLGAAGAGDIGTLYPSDDDRWRDVDSAALLAGAVAHLGQLGGAAVSLDLTLVAAHPAIAPRRNEMAARIAGLIGLAPEAVSLKGTTSDGLGFAGEEGIAAFAVAVVTRS